MRHGTLRSLTVAALAAAVPLLAGCVEDEIVRPVPAAGPGGELFERYVSLGNSITAGYQSGGINDSTQLEAYPVLLAEQAGAEFGVPLLAYPGCPPPFTEPLGPRRVAGWGAGDCALRVTPGPRLLQNLAVPGARTADLLNNLIPAEQLGSANPLTTLILGGRTQLEAMVAADPTLVSVWIGNNDALLAAVSGNLQVLTPLAAFEEQLDGIVGAIQQTPAQDAVLIGVVDAVRAAPILQPGAYFWAMGQTPGALPKPVNDNCAPVNPLTGQPNPLAANMVSFQVLGDTNFPEVNCSPDAFPEGDPRRGAHLLTMEEQGIVGARVAQFNAAIRQRAEASGWIYIDPNEVLTPYLAEGPPFNQVRKCQMLAALPTGATMQQFQQAVLQSCPVPPEMGGAPNFFGALISFDGVHPARPAHQLIANEMAERLNEAHGLSIPTR